MVLAKIKQTVKTLVEDAFWRYGKSCSSHPLRYVLISVVIVLTCSLPFLNIATLKKIMAFVGRIEAQNYHTTVTQLQSFSSLQESQVAAYVKQIQFDISLSDSSGELSSLSLNKLIFRVMKSGRVQSTIASLSQSEEGFEQICLRVSRASTLASWLVFSRSRFHGQLKKWFKDVDCLTISPSLLTNVSQHEFSSFPSSFKELVFGLPVNDALGYPLLSSKDHKSMVMVVSIFMKKHKQSYLQNLEEKLPVKEEDSLSTSGSSALYKVSYELLEDLGAIELVPLFLTYLIVFLYLLFSLAKVKTLRSRWGLAFSAIMTLTLSLGMTVGLCASLDLIPMTLSITEIFPYVVIVLGIENVLKITHSVMMTGEQFPLPDRVAHGLKQESFMMVKNMAFMLAILSVGLITNIPAIKEFSAFVSVGLICNFFLQLVFFTPILYVDIKRAGLLPLHMSIGDSLKISFNLIPHPVAEQEGLMLHAARSSLVTPEAAVPAEPRQYSFLYWWERLRVIQRLVMVSFVLYLSHSLFVTFYHQKVDIGVPRAPLSKDSSSATREESTLKCLSDYEARTHTKYLPWQFACTQIFPEIFSFYQMNLHGKYLVMLPVTRVPLNIGVADLEMPQYSTDGTLLALDSPLLLFLVVILLVVVPCCITYALVRRLHTCEVDEPQMDSFLWKGHEYQVEWIVTDGFFVASLCLGGVIRIWDSMTDHCTAVISRSALTSRYLPECEQDMHADRSASADDASTEREPPQVWCMGAFTGLLALGCSNGTVEIYSLTKACLVARQDDVSCGIICISFSSRKNVTAAHLDGSIDFISINWHRKQRSSGSIHGERLGDSCSELEDRLSQQCQYSNVPAFRDAIHIMVSVAGRVVAAGDNGIIKVFEGHDAVCLKSLRLRSGDINVIAVQEVTNPVVLCGGSEGTIHKFDVMRGQFVGDLVGLTGSIMSIKTNELYVSALSSLHCVTVWRAGSNDVVLSRTFASPVIDILLLGANILTVVMETHLMLIPIKGGQESPCQRHSSLESCMPLLHSQICCVDRSSVVIARGAEIEHIKFPHLVNKVE